jgi:glycosyltransferase involved in cell wall biosynthesis
MERMAAAFAIPGDIATWTGGYVYERRLLESLPEVGQPMEFVPLLPSWPYPTAMAAADAAARLMALPAERALILDGLVFGSIDTALLARLRCPVVAMLHHPLGLEAGLPADVANALIERERANLALTAHVVVTSEHTREIYIADFGVPADRITVALPGFDRPAPAAPQPPAAPPLILSVGIICARKGHDVLLQALARIKDLDWQAAIVGLTHDETVRQALLALRADLGLEGRVRFTGVIPAAELQGLWQSATLFALATRYEGYGLALSEAQMHGLPVVSCRVGAVPQTVPEGTGLLTPPDDPVAFADALRAVLGDAQMRARLTAASSAYGAALPRWTDTAAIMRDVLDRVRAGR